MADIADGFYVTDLIGMGVNQVTGDYSRGASGFWIENGKRSYPVSEVTIAGNLIDMFRALVARERSRVPLRHQRADRARGGTHRCRPMTPASIARRCAIVLPPPCGKPVRWRCRPFAASSRAGPRASPRRSAKPISRSMRCCGNGCWRIHDAGWLSEETRGRSGAVAASRRVGRRSDRRHAGLSRRPSRTGRSRWRW